MKTYNQFINEVKKPTGGLKDACRKRYTAVGMKMKGGRKVPNCVPEEVQQPVSEGNYNIRKDPTYQKYNPETHTMMYKDGEHKVVKHDQVAKAKSQGYKTRHSLKAFSKGQKGVAEEVEQLDEKTPAWQRKEGKNPEGGLNKKGVESYRRENPGSKLQTAVTTKPSKLKPGSKAANRRKSFCARMSGMKKRLTSAETARDPDSRINKSLRKWNC